MTKLRFPSSQYRSIPNPAGSGKVGLFFVRVAKVPPELNAWRDVNPREVKTSSAVYKAIVATLLDEPERFAERNRGLTVSASDVDYDDKRKEVVLTVQDRALHGVVDGGHTLHAILEDTADGTESQAEVFIKVMTGIGPDQIAEIAGGLNSSQQVDLRSIENLEGHFQKLRERLRGEPYEDNIAYKMNQDKEIDVREILYYLAVFDAEAYDENTHPTKLFGRKEGIVRTFASQHKKNGDPDAGDSFKILITKAPEILRLRDEIEKRALAEDVGRYKAGKKERVRSRNNRGSRLHFLDEEVDGKVPLGWIMPMLGGFRANVNWNKPKGSFSWKVPLEELLDKCFDGLLAGIVEIHDRENARPEYVGRSATAWRMCYERVKTAILEHELAAMKRR